LEEKIVKIKQKKQESLRKEQTLREKLRLKDLELARTVADTRLEISQICRQAESVFEDTNRCNQNLSNISNQASTMPYGFYETNNEKNKLQNI